MKRTDAMEIIATGMVCSVGLTAATACAAMRARIAKFDELPYVDNSGEPIIGATVLGLEPALRRRERLVEMLAMALEDCLRSGGVKHTERIPLLIGLARPGRPGAVDWAGRAIADLESRLGVRFDQRWSATFATGHTAGFEALKQARELLRNPAVPACLVCGVDSYFSARALWWLEQHQRLKTEENSDGVIPGEAAACVLLQRSDAVTKPACVARLIGLGFAREEATILTEEPLLGLGLADAARAALADAGLPMHEIDFRISDVSGESYGFREQALVQSRLIRVRRECQPIWHCVDSIGDTGAAAGICQLVIVQDAFQNRYAPGKRAMGFTSDVDGGRAVAVIERHVAEASKQSGPRGG